MKYKNRFFALAVTSLLLVSCQKDVDVMESSENEDMAGQAAVVGIKGGMAGQVYTLSNGTGANEVLVFNRTAGGLLSSAGTYATGGTGTGGGLGNQGAVTLTKDNRRLLVVNPGSNSVSSFMVKGAKLNLVSTVPSGGIMPVSITVHDSLVYVLNSGGSGNISGFRLMANGTLQPLSGSSRPLSSASAGAAQVSFTDDGSAVVITEKATNMIISYTITAGGVPGTMHALPSANATPFGFAAGKNGIIYVSEAAGGAPGASTVSSYKVGSNGAISLLDGPVSAGQTAACWVAVNNNSKHVYATNTGSHTVTAFTAGKDGTLDVLEAAISTSPGTVPIDVAMTGNSKFLYELNAGTESIGAFRVEKDGRLTHIQDMPGLPNGATGLAAR